MGTKTKIEWTESTWNPVTGCTKISPGCKNCYAERMSHRLAGRCGYPADAPFRVTMHPGKLPEPMKWKKPRMIFVVSMGDLFHESVPDWYIAAVWAVMIMANQHTYQVLTKRPGRALSLLTNPEWGQMITRSMSLIDHDTARLVHLISGDKPVSHDRFVCEHVWIGTTIEDQARAEERIDKLLKTPAAVRFVSVEPMLGEVDLDSIWPGGVPRPGAGPYVTGLDWVICGAETGPGARQMDPDWARKVRDDCTRAGVPFFFKKDSRKSRLLDGREWNGVPR